MTERSKQNYEDYYERIEVVGAGGYGIIYRGREKETNEIRAIKIMEIEKITGVLLSQYEIEEIEEQLKLCIEGFIQEFKNMKICSKDNNNSVKCYEYFNNKDSFVIIMELCDQNLLQLLNNRLKDKKKGFNSEEIYEIMKGLNNTFKIMKENNIIHRDLKLENILIKYDDKEHKKFKIKLSDYGCSKRLISLSKNCNTHAGTDEYMAPEILNGGEYNYKCDLWSIGIIIYRLIFGKSPYIMKAGTENALLNIINKFNNKNFKKTGNGELDDLIKKLLEKDPIKRIGWDEYFNHPFFKYKTKIEVIYYIEEDGINNIFGEKFVENNKNKIELIINGQKNELLQKYKLKKGENNIQIIIKNKINDLEGMFKHCNTLKKIEGLKNLDTEEIKNFSYMFYECSSLSDINGLENWNVSNGINFSYMFYKCSSLKDINGLENWNVSNGINFSYMFYECSLLSNLNGLENWNVSKGIHFSFMFHGCSSLKDLNGLENWKISNGKDFIDMLNECFLLSNKNGLKNLKFLNEKNWDYMLSDPEKLKYLRNIIFLNIQKKEMIELTKNSIKGQEPIKCKLINKDIINEYMNDSISNQIYLDLEKYKINKKIDNYSELYDEIHIKNIINEKKKKINDIDLADKFFNPTLLMVEYSKTNNIEYPFNFFIIRTSVFDQIMGVVGSVLVEFKTYDVLIGKEGIFIWDEKPNEINGFKFIIYYIKDIKTDEEYTINKIILLKEKTTKYIENLDKYLKLTELKEKSGYFNIIDDGKIIGKYLNIIKNINFQYRESKIEKKSQDFDSYIQAFLPYILLSLSSINKLNQYFLNKENINEKNDLIKTFINIIKKLASNKDDLVSDIYDFIDIFNKRNLFEKFEMPENKKDIWEIFINLLLDEFQKELKKKEKNKIFDIFNGIQKINSTEKSFKTMDIKGSAKK